MWRMIITSSTSDNFLFSFEGSCKCTFDRTGFLVGMGLEMIGETGLARKLAQTVFVSALVERR